jgi:gas vesicle protein
MNREKANFLIGLLVGGLLAFLFNSYFAPRYHMVKSGQALIKQDRWSGDAWQLVEGQWKKMISTDRDWESIDQALRHVLQIPGGGMDTEQTLNLLKKSDPVLSDVSNDELLERIKIVYSKEILAQLYLKNFLKARQEESSSQDRP